MISTALTFGRRVVAFSISCPKPLSPSILSPTFCSRLVERQVFPASPTLILESLSSRRPAEEFSDIVSIRDNVCTFWICRRLQPATASGRLSILIYEVLDYTSDDGAMQDLVADSLDGGWHGTWDSDCRRCSVDPGIRGNE